MAVDYSGQIRVKTVEDNSFKLQVADGQSGIVATHKLSIVKAGDTLTDAVNNYGVVALAKNAAGEFAIPSLGTYGSKVELYDEAGDQLNFIADGEAIGATKKGLGLFGSDGAAYQIMAMTAAGFVRTQIESLPAITIAANQSVEISNIPHVIVDSLPAVTVAGVVKVEVVHSTNVQVCDYQTTPDLAKFAVAVHDYAVASGALHTGSVHVGSRGECKVEIGTWNGTTFVPKFVYFQLPGFNPPLPLSNLHLAGGVGIALRIRITNLDNLTDVHSTLQGVLEA